MTAQGHPLARALTVIFKGSNRCNAKCTYCSVGQPGARMVSWDDFEVLAANLDELVAAWPVGQVVFTFHGGEPTLLGADFIDGACTRIRQLPVTVAFAMQSNLLRWTEDMDRVVGEHDISVGSSIDPLSGARLDEQGLDAYDTWLENYVRLAQRRRAPGAIFVVTRKALGQAKKLYTIAESIAEQTGQRFGLQINPVYGQGRAAGEDSLLITAPEFGEFLVEIWHAWRASPDGVRLTPIQDLSEFFFPVPGTSPSLSCAFGRDCSRSHVGVDFDLNVASCGRRLDSRAFLGNLADRSLREILEGAEEAHQVAQRAEGLRQTACQGCAYFEMCYGGCPDDADIATGDLGNPFEWCESYRMLFGAMDAARVASIEPGAPTPLTSRVTRPKAVVHAVLDPHEIPGLEGPPGATSIWLLPDATGASLRFESGLAMALEGTEAQVRLWVHNRHVPSLTLLEEALGSASVAAVLFEGEGLAEALELLNELGAHVGLHLPTLLETPGAADVVAQVLERFFHDPQWRSPIHPFSSILLKAIRGPKPRYLNRWGLAPESFELRVHSLAAEATGFGAHLIEALETEEGVTTTGFLRDRAGCRACALLPICGGQFALADGEVCPPEPLALVERIREVGRQVDRDMQSLPSPDGAP